LMGRPGAPWKRVVLKVSGEALASEAADEVIDGRLVERLAQEIAECRAEFGTEIAVVIGGGNIWRGAVGSATGMDRATADYMGMLATVINALALRDALEREGQPTRVQTAIGMSELAEPYIRLRAIRHLEKGRVVIFAAGTGNPFFTTDTAGAVDAVYTADPRLDPTAQQIAEIEYSEVLGKDLRAMDLTAITLCKENSLPILYFSIMEEGNLRSALAGDQIGTLIH
jgi:uridylate kinase